VDWRLLCAVLDTITNGTLRGDPTGRAIRASASRLIRAHIYSLFRDVIKNSWRGLRGLRGYMEQHQTNKPPLLPPLLAHHPASSIQHPASRTPASRTSAADGRIRGLPSAGPVPPSSISLAVVPSAPTKTMSFSTKKDSSTSCQPGGSAMRRMLVHFNLVLVSSHQCTTTFP